MAIFSPVSGPLFVPTLYTFGGVFGASLAAIVAAERARFSRIAQSSLFRRWRTWAVIAPVFALAILSGPTLVVALMIVVGTVGVLEFAALTKLGHTQRAALLGTATVLPVVAWLAPSALLAALVLGLLAAAIAAMRDGAAGEPASSFLGVVYVPLLLSFGVLLAAHVAGGDGLLLAIGVATGLSDVAAFTCGKTFGRRKLAPRLSPNKTYAGALGGLAGAYGAFALMWFALPDLPLWAAVVLPTFVAAAGLSGDLFESMLKRSAGVKDAGAWLPGFGGMLDRIDSVLFVLPAAYIFVTAVTHGGIS
jgi:phosphatidate cytidylyltransferase